MKLKLSTLTLSMLLASTSALAQSDWLGTFAGEAANPTKAVEGASVAIPELDMQAATATCAAEYLEVREPKQSLYDSCIDSEKRAYDELKAAWPNGALKDVPAEVMADLIRENKKEHLGREYDYSYFKLRVTGTANDYLDAQWELKQGKNTQAQYEECVEKWESWWSQVHRCLQEAAKDAPPVAKSEEISVAKADESSATKTDDVDLQFLDSSQIEDELVLSGLSACKSHVRANAKDPSSVNWRQLIYAGESGGIYIYMMTVQATNSFGGPTVQTLNCGYRPEDGFLVVQEA